MTTGVAREHNMEKQMGGCMAGFLNIFDRHQSFIGKRRFATRRLPPSAVESEPETERSSRAVSTELSQPQQSRSPPSPDGRNECHSQDIGSPAPDSRAPVGENPARTPLPLSILELKEGAPRSPWRFSKESPRLSLDSRSIVDARGVLKPREIQTNPETLAGGLSEIDDDVTDEKRQRSPSVIARLMGLERLPSPDSEPTQNAELRRSASESRLNRDRYVFNDGGRTMQPGNHCADPKQQRFNVVGDQKNNNGANQENGRALLRAAKDQQDVHVGTAETARRSVQRGIISQKRNFFDSADFFPEMPPKQSVSVYGEMEKKLKMRGVDETCKDLDTLKQILEALQLKGLLHPNKLQSHNENSNFALDTSNESPIFVLRPVGDSPVQSDRGARRSGRDSSHSSPRSRIGARPTAGEVSPAGSPRLEKSAVDRRGRVCRQNVRSQARGECGLRSPSRRKKSTTETNNRLNEPPLEQRRQRPVQSPKTASKRLGPVQTLTNSSPRNRKRATKVSLQEEKQLPVPDDALPTISGSSLSTSSPADREQRDCKDGKNLLERCGKLLDCIAEMTATARATAGELQPSPVSVLDSSFFKETSPPPILKRRLDFNEQSLESEDETSSSAISSNESKSSDVYDFAYVSDIIRASNHLANDLDVFSLLEKQQYLKGKDSSKVSRLGRRLIFDTINEIIDRKRNHPPWKATVGSYREIVSMQVIWSEFQKIKQRDESEDLFETICGALRKDLANDEITDWGGCHVEVSETILEIERLVFKDLISETIRYLAAFAGNSHTAIASGLRRRKLVF